MELAMQWNSTFYQDSGLLSQGGFPVIAENNYNRIFQKESVK